MGTTCVIKAANQTRPFKEIVGFFSAHKPELQIPVKDMPDFLVHVFALFMPPMKTAQRWLGYRWSVDEASTRNALNITLVPEKQTAADMVDDFIKLGAVPAEKPARKRTYDCLPWLSASFV